LIASFVAPIQLILTQAYQATIGDVYEACIETDRDKYENVQIFDTPGWVSDLFISCQGRDVIIE